MKPIDELKILRCTAHAPEGLCNVVLLDGLFLQAPSSAGHHPGPHQARGGLVLHTLEVVKAAMEMSVSDLTLMRRAYIAGLFHDYGKVFEYQLTDNGVIKLPFAHLIGHIAYSWKYFTDAAARCLSPEDIEEIGHAILAHHGRWEWHSPVEPQTRLAYILHSADMLSAKGQ